MTPILKDMYHVIDIAKQAGRIIMNIYNKSFSVDYKSDNTPFTEADIESHHLISNELSKFYPDIPILSEESAEDFTLDDINECFWCVDPLDGTKEFVRKSDEFTVNIALIQNQQPIIGVIYVPAKRSVYAAVKNKGAFKQQDDNSFQKIFVKSHKSNNLTFAISRSHIDDQTKEIVARHKAQILQAGSALKLAYVAEGLVDIYPRFGPTMLWDVAAGQCLIEEAGGKVILAENHQPMNYNINYIKNRPFIASNETPINEVEI